MTTLRTFGESLQKTVLAFGLSLVLFAAFGTPVRAGDLPKEGTYSTTWTFSGPYTLVEIGEEKWSYVAAFTEVVWNNAGEGVLHNMSANCNGLGAASGEGNGYCNYVDADGDKIYTAWEDLTEGKGKATILGGTGKYAGIQGSEEYEYVYTPDSPEGTFHGHGGSKGSYTLP